MTNPVPDSPDWTRRCLGSDILEIPAGDPYMLRNSDDPDSAWRHVKTRTQGYWKDPNTGAYFEYITMAFHDDAAERVINKGDEIEVGFIRPPWWPADMEPPEWPVRDS